MVIISVRILQMLFIIELLSLPGHFQRAGGGSQ